MLDLETAMKHQHCRQIKGSKPNNGNDKEMQWVWWHVLPFQAGRVQRHMNVLRRPITVVTAKPTSELDRAVSKAYVTIAEGKVTKPEPVQRKPRRGKTKRNDEPC
jgi:hypothetical protein